MASLKKIADAIGAKLRGGDRDIVQVSSAALADGASLVFAEDETALQGALQSSAAAVLLTEELAKQASDMKSLLLMQQPRLGFARAARMLRSSELATGVHSSAVVGHGAVLGQNVSVGAYAVIEEDANIGVGTRIGPGCVIGRNARIGQECRIYPRVVLYPGVTLGDRVVVHAGAVLGGDGFGYVRDAASGEYLQFPQQGVLIIEDDVEIGANTTVDRGALAETRIARGVKLDNLVHVGHNVSIGKNVVIAAQTGVSGSSVIGDDAIVGGQVGIADHVEIGEKVILGAQAGIPSRKKIRGPGIVFWGTPARPIKDYLKELAALSRLTRASKRKED
ncbi:UDP-3-O-(3-hydroxymyristoyl)glucosamine N-acyltransferase [Acidobacterium sp. S8]|uniref:UDP-3-O-(3-hydroxymyristoyl)glucosamine N-acyltransferase n=1 Tax=Acidobacterium sp. S8 TaxID=1641854 RepID=UPI00131EA363|nr:UDP-3-O-(3-hydroxymyristoyl)glucosamine N-acyltransferase [Acidobacterium sp. S8]